MATGSASVSVTLPVTGAVDPNNVGRTLATQALLAAAQAIQANLAQTSGNILRQGDTPRRACHRGNVDHHAPGNLTDP